MSEADREHELKAAFHASLQALHAAGWDVVAVASRALPTATETHRRVLLHAAGAGRGASFLRCLRALREDVTAACAAAPSDLAGLIFGKTKGGAWS